MNALAAFALLAFPLTAQTCFYNWSSDPTGGLGGFSDIFSFTASAPFNQPVQRHHLLVPAVVFQNVPARITELSIGVRQGMRSIRFDELTIRMSQTSVVSVDYLFANNITAPMQEVLSLRDHVWQQGFGPDFVPFGLQQPFQFVPGQGNLLIEVVLRAKTLLADFSFGAGGSSPLGGWTIGGGTILPTMATSGGNVPQLRFCIDRAEAALLGQSCQGSASSTPLLGITGRPTPGAFPTLWLSDVAANAIAACAFGFGTTAAPFPIDLTPLGATGCRQYFAPGFADLVVASAVGIGQDQILIPTAPSVIGSIVHAQYYVLDPAANALGITSSNYGRLLVGL